ncbi:MAG TPA: hypothetical protein VLB44_15085 [Kofleriaceae bacterium]|nr:hypothetical protein [Kofleriaceae bacterium]
MREIMIVASDIAPTVSEHAFVVSTPLDAIIQLEKCGRIRTVVLAGTFAYNRDLEACIGELYPSIQIEREA